MLTFIAPEALLSLGQSHRHGSMQITEATQSLAPFQVQSVFVADSFCVSTLV